eukprot:369796_1
MATCVMDRDFQIQEPPTKRLKTAPLEMRKPAVIVLDIEGTVLSKSFYDDVLLPYTRDNFREFLYENSDLEHIYKRIEMIKDRYFSQYPDKESSFDYHFTDAAYHEYLEQMRQTSMRNHAQHIQSQIHGNGTTTNAPINAIQSEQNDATNHKNILEIENKLEIIDDIPTTVAFIDDGTFDTQHSQTQTDQSVMDDNAKDCVQMIEKMISIYNVDDNEDIDLIDHTMNEENNKEDVIEIKDDPVIEIEDVIEINNDISKETVSEHGTKEDAIVIQDDHDSNSQNRIETHKETVSGNKRKLVDIIDIDDDDDDEHNTNGVIEINSDSDSEESESDVSVLSKTEFYRSKQIDLLMEMIDEWFDSDLKIRPLQYLQGLLIDKGFKSNEIRGNIYRDCYESILKWTEEDDITVYIYSHGTKAAQQLLFKYSVFGDLDEYISGYFDKYTTGNKRDTESYFRLLRDIQADQWENHNESIEDDMMCSILFISDHALELEAAHNAGLTVIQSVRKDVEPCLDFDQVTDFNQIEWIEPQKETIDVLNNGDHANYNHLNGGHTG